MSSPILFLSRGSPPLVKATMSLLPFWMKAMPKPSTSTAETRFSKSADHASIFACSAAISGVTLVSGMTSAISGWATWETMEATALDSSAASCSWMASISLLFCSIMALNISMTAGNCWSRSLFACSNWARV